MSGRKYDPDEAQAKRDALAATKDFPGVTGNITIDADRNASKPAVIIEIKNGQYNYLQTIAP